MGKQSISMCRYSRHQASRSSHERSSTTRSRRKLVLNYLQRQKALSSHNNLNGCISARLNLAPSSKYESSGQAFLLFSKACMIDPFPQREILPCLSSLPMQSRFCLPVACCKEPSQYPRDSSLVQWILQTCRSCHRTCTSVWQLGLWLDWINLWTFWRVSHTRLSVCRICRWCVFFAGFSMTESRWSFCQRSTSSTHVRSPSRTSIYSATASAALQACRRILELLSWRHMTSKDAQLIPDRLILYCSPILR